MRILFVSADNGLYGANRAMLNLIHQLQAKNIYCEVLLSRSGIVEKELNKLNVKYYVFKFAPWLTYDNQPKWKDLCRKIYNTLSFNYIAFRLRKNKFDIVHTNSSVTDVGVFLANKMHCEHVWHIRERAAFHKLKYIYPMSYVKETYNKSSALVAISNYIAVEHENLTGSKKCQIVYDGIPLRKPGTSTENSDNKLKICVVGAISPNKNQLFVCENIKKMVDHGMDSIKCYIVGGASDYNYYNELLEYISKMKLEEFVELTGQVDDPYQIYKNCDVGIMASNGEGFGLVTVEYMMSGMLVIGNRSGATPEIIEDSVNGLLYDNDNPDGLFRCLENCYWHLNNYKTIRENAIRSAIDRFSIDEHTNKIMSLYKELVRDKS